MTTLTVTGKNLFATNEIVKQVWTDLNDQYIIVKGCIVEQNPVSNGVDLTFSTVKNPYAVRTTSPLKIELYK